MPHAPGNGYDPIVGVQGENPTEVMTISMVKWPADSVELGPPSCWEGVGFTIAFKKVLFKSYDSDSRKWVPLTDGQMPFDVVGLEESSCDAPPGGQVVVPMEYNKDYEGPFPACLEVEFTMTVVGDKDVEPITKTARAVMFTNKEAP